MLSSLSIRDFIIVDSLNVNFQAGLTAITGETGAGKSILLDALGIALGKRGNAKLIRHGKNQATVAAEFEEKDNHPIFSLLSKHDILVENPIILKRTITQDGRNRSFINDQPVSVGLLRLAGELLIEIHGQFDRLLNQDSHLAFLDDYGELSAQCKKVSSHFTTWKALQQQLEEIMQKANNAKENEEFLRHSIEELATISPRAGEEHELQAERNRRIHYAKLREGLVAASQAIAADDGAEAKLNKAYRSIEACVEHGGDDFSLLLTTIDQATNETLEAINQLQHLQNSMDDDPEQLDAVEERLTILRDLARKHKCSISDLPDLHDRLLRKIEEITDSTTIIAKIQVEIDASRANYIDAAKILSEKRSLAAVKLDQAIKDELHPLKMERSRFKTEVLQLPEDQWSTNGVDRVNFTVSTNPGIPFGKLATIASGGERARFMLALKVVLAHANLLNTLIFDEVDSGVGGSVAHAVGKRLSLLGQSLQVLVITHSPQVASIADNHWKVVKNTNGSHTTTTLFPLDRDDRSEEVARMLAGETITKEARAAADQLLLKAAG